MSKTAPTPDDYVVFLGQAELKAIGLDSAEANVDRIALAKANESDGPIPVTLDAEFSVLLRTEDRLVISAFCRLNQSAKSEDGETNPMLRIHATFSALFQLGVPCSEVDANRFANSEAKLIFWPYLRHFISDISYRMSINPIIIPLMTATSASPLSEVQK